MRRGLRGAEGAVRREVAQRVDRQQVDPRRRARGAVDRAALERGAELLRQAQQAEVVDVHLGLGHVGATARSDAEGAVHLGVVDHDVDLAADGTGQLGHLAAVGEVQRHERDLRQRRDVIEPVAHLLPGLGMADPDDVGAGLHQRAHEGLARLGLAVGHQHLAELGVAGHFAQHLVVGHVGTPFSRKSNEDGLAGAVEPGADTHARGRIADLAVQVDHERGAGIQVHQAQPPGQPLAKEQVVAVVQRGAAEQRALAALLAPAQRRRQALVADLARRVLHRAAVFAGLQLEAAFGGGGREAERDAAACAGRQVHLPGAQHRVLARGAHHRHRHAGLPRMTAPVHRQRS
eukprot:Opistho-1_new@100762